MNRSKYFLIFFNTVSLIGQEPLFQKKGYIDYCLLSDTRNYQYKIQDWLWYTHYVPASIDYNYKDLKKIVVGVIDFFQDDVTVFAESKDFLNNFYFDLNNRVKIMQNLTLVEQCLDDQSNNQKNKNLLPELMKKKRFVIDLLKNNHGLIAATCIRLCAPHVEVIPITIPDNATVYDLYHALVQAVQYSVDVVYIGWQWNVVNTDEKIKKRIEKFIKEKHFVVVAPVANDFFVQGCVGYPASNNMVVGVGSFCKNINILCAKSPSLSFDFVMPGQNIATTVWTPELQEYIIIKVSGNSFAAAFMAGYIAHMLELGCKKSNVIKKMKKKCRHLHKSWSSIVRYGTPL